METLQSIFTTRELSIGVWLCISIIGILFTKVGRKFAKDTLPIIFCKKFVIFYLVMALILVGGIFILYKIGFWEWSMVKDTVLWVFIVEIPICAKAINDAKNEKFFTKMLKDNVKI